MRQHKQIHSFMWSTVFNRLMALPGNTVFIYLFRFGDSPSTGRGVRDSHITRLIDEAT